VAIVRATCPTCGDVEMGIGSVQVQVCVTTTEATYSFVCPDCQVIVNKEANDAIVESLTKAGSRLVTWSLPAELAEVKIGPPINHDDLLEFHLALESGGLEQELAALAPRS
jgi:hypothetical protein